MRVFMHNGTLPSLQRLLTPTMNVAFLSDSARAPRGHLAKYRVIRVAIDRPPRGIVFEYRKNS